MLFSTLAAVAAVENATTTWALCTIADYAVNRVFYWLIGACDLNNNYNLQLHDSSELLPVVTG